VTKPRAVALIALQYLPLVGLVSLLGFGFGWRAPVGVALFVGLFYARLKTDLRWPYGLHPNRFRLALDFLGSAVIGVLVGSLLYGGVGGIFGLAIAVIWTLGAIPVTTTNAEGARVPLTLQSSPAAAKALTAVGFLLPLFLLGLCVLLVVAH
jgi:hypothetical protein